MKPICLAFKDYRINPFTNMGGGELMIIHQCLNCGKLSANRIAGDDNECELLSILKETLVINKKIPIQVQNLGFTIIDNLNKEDALIVLFGKNYSK